MPTNRRLHTLQVIAFAFSFLVLVALTAFWSVAQENRFAVAHAVPASLSISSKQGANGEKQASLTHHGGFSKQSWTQYHRLALPVTVGVFFLCFSCWSLTGVENLAIRQ